MSEVKVNKISPRSGTDVTLGDSGDTFTVPTGVTLDTSNSTVTLPDGSVTSAKLNNDIISGATELATAPADTDEFLVSDAGTLKRIDYSLIKATSGLTIVDVWRLTADITNTNGVITSNLEQPDTDGATTIGSSMSESSGIFTFPETGKYMIICQGTLASGGGTGDDVSLQTQTTTDGTNYNAAATVRSDVPDGVADTGSSFFLFDVTNTTTHKVRFNVSGMSDGGSVVKGNTGANETAFIFQKLGDT